MSKPILAAVLIFIAVAITVYSGQRMGTVTGNLAVRKGGEGNTVPSGDTGTPDAAVVVSAKVDGVTASASAKVGKTVPSVSAKSAILIDGRSGKVLYEKDADTKRPMASTTKIMTGILAIETCDPGKTVTIPKAAVGVEGSSVYLYEGEKLTMEELVYSLMLQSANDAATAIAVEISGSTEEFAGVMNEKAAELGLTNTSFANPHGLNNENHYTTARDLANLAAYALKNESFRQITSTLKKAIPMGNGEGTRLLVNHNRLLRSYDGAIGVKTGFTKKSGRCLVSAAERDGVMLIAVTLDAPDDWRDHTAMLDYGFGLIENVKLTDGISGTAALVGGEKEFFAYSSKTGLSVNLEKGSHDIRAVTEIKRFYFAGVNEGDKIGRTVFYDGDTEVGTLDLYADETVEKRYEKLPFFEWLFSLFR